MRTPSNRRRVALIAAVLAALLILLRLFARGFALLRALGAPSQAPQQ